MKYLNEVGLGVVGVLFFFLSFFVVVVCSRQRKKEFDIPQGLIRWNLTLRVASPTWIPSITFNYRVCYCSKLWLDPLEAHINLNEITYPQYILTYCLKQYALAIDYLQSYFWASCIGLIAILVAELINSKLIDSKYCCFKLQLNLVQSRANCHVTSLTCMSQEESPNFGMLSLPQNLGHHINVCSSHITKLFTSLNNISSKNFTRIKKSTVASIQEVPSEESSWNGWFSQDFVQIISRPSWCLLPKQLKL